MKVFFPYILALVLLLAGVLLALYSFQAESPELVAKQISSNVAMQLKALEREASSVKTEISKAAQDINWDAFEHSFFIYENGNLVLWSNNDFIPQGRQLLDTFDIKLIKISGGDYLVKKWPIDKARFLVSLIPLYRQYPIRNDYLYPEWNKQIFPDGIIEILEPTSARGESICLEGACLFRISYKEGDITTHTFVKVLSVLFISIAIAFFVFLTAGRLYQFSKRHPDVTFLFLIAIIWSARYVMTALDFPGVLIRTSLFNPQYYASSSLNRSMGDLLLNELALFVICYYLLRNYCRMRMLRWVHTMPWLQLILSLACGFIFFLGLYYPFLVIKNIYNNSAITLDISQSVQFDELRVVAYLVVILSWVCAFLFSHVFLKLLLANRSFVKILLCLLVGTLLFVFMNNQTGQPSTTTLIVASVYFIVVYFGRLHKSLRQVNYNTFSYFFTAIICFGVLSALTILSFTRKEKIETQFRFASNFLVDRDIFGEYLLREAANKISNDVFIQSRITSPFLNKDVVRQKVRQVFLPSYFNKYDVEVMLFGAAGTPFDNRSPISFSNLMSKYNKEAFRTEYDGVYFISSPEQEVTQRYLIVIPITKSGLTLGYVVLELLLKKVIPDNVYPELLIDNRFQQFYRMQDISYAVYGKEMLYSSGSFNYEKYFKREMLGDPAIHLEGIVHEGYIHVAEEDESNRVAVVSSPVMPTRYVVANFSFLLVLGLSILLLFILSQGIVNFIQGKTLSFSTRIQLFLNLAFFLPLLIVSVTTLQFTSLSSREQLNTEFLNKSKSFGSQVASLLESHVESDDVNQVSFENQLSDMAKLFNLDANVFYPNGKLLASSQPFIFESGMIAPYISPQAMQDIQQGQSLFISSGKVGDLEFNTCYAALRSSQRGELLGILALPFFQSLNSLERIQISILANILNVFSGIFIVLIILSYVVSKWLTFPLQFITQSLSRTSLVKTNQPLIWNADDEIGLMAKEYNQMLFKLSESKAELEQTQRERAWREIAQQVAHEIKNPLTPMKLTLQQLERSLESGADIHEKTSKAVVSLLSQVNTLNDIASSFSSFAKMPEPEIQKLELIQLMKRIVDLHSHGGLIVFKPTLSEVYISGDEQLLGRIFSNLILNSFQAARPGVTLKVEIDIQVKEANVLIRFKDNGRGIDPKLVDRVFVPHFSTKHSGSGLGLAISKQGIEHMHGKIGFETIANEGTTFFIELPLVG